MPHCRLTPTVIQSSGRELTVCGVMRLSAELEAPPEGWGRCGEIQGLSRPFGDIGKWESGVPCGYMSGDLLLTCQVPQGNLGTMMRILINSAGAMCAYPSLGRSESATWRVCCTALRFGELSRGPSHPPRL